MHTSFPTALLLFVFHVQTSISARSPRLRDDGGEATPEYGLILLAAALVGLMVVAWATADGGAARISRLFNSVIDSVINKV